MQTINLKQYYPFCTEDTFVEVSDEIVEAFLLDKAEPRRDGLHGELPGLQRVHADSNPDTGVSNFLSAPPIANINISKSQGSRLLPGRKTARAMAGPHRRFVRKASEP